MTDALLILAHSPTAIERLYLNSVCQDANCASFILPQTVWGPSLELLSENSGQGQLWVTRYKGTKACQTGHREGDTQGWDSSELE